MIDSESDPIGWIAEQIDTFKAYEKRERVLTVPSDESLSWTDRRTRLVRLDVAIIAIHLWSVRVGVKSMPGVIRQRVVKTLKTIGRAVGEAIIGKVFGKVVVKFLRSVTVVYDMWLASVAQLEIENAVRRAGVRSQRELYLLKLAQRRKVRRRERVLTRHPVPKQRRPNGHPRVRR